MDAKGKNKNLDHLISAIATMDSDMLEKVNIYIENIESAKHLANKECLLPLEEKSSDDPI